MRNKRKEKCEQKTNPDMLRRSKRKGNAQRFLFFLDFSGNFSRKRKTVPFESVSEGSNRCGRLTCKTAGEKFPEKSKKERERGKREEMKER